MLLEDLIMRCASCGGTIDVDEHCEDCGIDYMDMLNAIEHREMKRLFVKMEEMIRNHEDVTLESSLLACEFENSSFILPVILDEDSISVINLPGPDNNNYIAILTDMDEFRNPFFENITPLTNSWEAILTLRNDASNGFVINPLNEAVVISNEYLKDYFG